MDSASICHEVSVFKSRWSKRTSKRFQVISVLSRECRSWTLLANDPTTDSRVSFDLNNWVSQNLSTWMPGTSLVGDLFAEGVLPLSQNSSVFRGRLVYWQDSKTTVSIQWCINCGEGACSSNPSSTCVICLPYEACDSQTIFMHVRSATRLLMPFSW